MRSLTTLHGRRLWLAGAFLLVVAGVAAGTFFALEAGGRPAVTADEDICLVHGVVATGGGTASRDVAVPCGETAVLTATADEGYCFSHWVTQAPAVGCPATGTLEVETEFGTLFWGVFFKPAPELVLRLSAAPICDVEEPSRYYGALSDGTDGLGSWDGVAEVAVSWTITGGVAPFTITIDGETRDGDGDYEGASGSAMVSCALDKGGEVRYWEHGRVVGSPRSYVVEPVVDSGYKLITASVTDANGLTAEATVEVYAVYNGVPDDRVLQAGQTYRLSGYLITIPDGLDMEYGWKETPDCDGGGRCPTSITILAHQNGVTGAFHIALDTGAEHGQRYYRWSGSGGAVTASSAQSSTDAPVDALEARFDELAAKLGQLPEPPALTEE